MSLTNIRLVNIIDHFFISHPDSGQREGEEEKKLLYFYPRDASKEKQLRSIGFAEAVIKFSGTFNGGDEDDETPAQDETQRASGDQTEPTLPPSVSPIPPEPYVHVQTEQMMHIYSQYEHDEYILGMAFRCDKADEQSYVLHPPALYRVLQTAYEMFRLFFGTMSSLHRVHEEDAEAHADQLKERLEYFFARYLCTLKLHSLPLVDVYSGVQYMQLDSITFLKVQNILARVNEELPEVAYTAFLYQDQLLWYTVPKDDLSIVYFYLTQNLLPMSLRAELQPDAQRKLLGGHPGKFVTGPPNLDSMNDLGKLPIVFLHDVKEDKDHASSDVSNRLNEVRLEEQHSNMSSGSGDTLNQFHLIVYRALNATVALLVPINVEQALKLSFFRAIDSLLGAQLTQVAGVLADIYAQQAPSTSTGSSMCELYHYVYYNPCSRSVKASFIGPLWQQQNPSNTQLPLAVIRLLCDLHEQAKASPDAHSAFNNVLAKTDSDWWVACRRCNDRLINIMLLPHKSASLVDVQDEVKRICATHFGDVFTAT